MKMKRLMTSLMALAMIASVSVADEAASGTEKACSGKTCALEGSACSGAGCPIETAMSKLPAMTYLVGTESTSCSVSAEKLSAEHNVPVKYVAMKKTFDSKADAMAALAEETEQFVSTFVSTKKCDVSGKFTVAGKELCCEVMAGERAEIAKKAMDSVEMTYLVGTEECSCPNQAATLAKASGTEKQFVIAGEKTCCSIDARVRLAHAKYKAAVTALAKADAPADNDEEESANL
ncbi:hypothetical protein N9N28_11255 [Rubripirellula amarantea]|nr:hypothetical protein [Rubripirellula amarantea]